MKKFRYVAVFLVLSILISLSVFCAENKLTAKKEFTFDGMSLAEFASVQGQPEIKGKSAYAINLNTGALVFEKNADEVVYPASTVKLMTAIVAYENISDLEVMITASSTAVNKTHGSNIRIEAGEEYTAQELLKALLISGANDAALVLSEHVAGSEEEFVKLMNEKAKELGLQNTNFSNVTGFHDENMYTTARDIGIIGQHFYYISELFDMSNEKSFKTDRIKRTLVNRNYLLSRAFTENYFRSDAAGMSVGSTPEGGNCIVSTVTGNDGQVYLVVVMNSPEIEEINYVYEDVESIFDFCTDNFSYQTVASVKDVMCEIPVNNAVDIDYFTLFPDTDIKMLLPNDLDYASEIHLEKRLFKDEANAPVNRMDVFGEVVVKYRDTVPVGRAKLVSDVSVDKSNVLYFLNRIERIVTGKWFVAFFVTALVLFAVYFGMSVYYAYFRKNRYTGNRPRRRR